MNSLRHWSFRWLAGWSLVLVSGAFCLAQKNAKDDEPAAIPAEENLKEETKDGVSLFFTYYPGGFQQTSEGVKKIDPKTVVPIILLHDWAEKPNDKPSRKDLAPLAAYLQRFGHAVVAPDLRGHGQSTTQGSGTAKKTIVASRMLPKDMGVVSEDVETVKRFLMKKNNAGELNIEMLTVIGVEWSASLATSWAVQDWSYAPLPNMKQGNDVKAIVLISPSKAAKGLPIVPLLKSPVVQKALSVAVVSGNESKSYKDSKYIHDQIEIHRETKFETPKDRNERKDLWMFELDTGLDGAQLFKGEGIQERLFRNVAGFIHLRLVTKKEEFPWKDRTRKL